MNIQNESTDLAKDNGVKKANVKLAELLFMADDNIQEVCQGMDMTPRIHFKLGKDHVILQPNINHHTVHRNEGVYLNLKELYSDPDKKEEWGELASNYKFLCKDFVVVSESEENKENIHPVILTEKDSHGKCQLVEHAIGDNCQQENIYVGLIDGIHRMQALIDAYYETQDKEHKTDLLKITFKFEWRDKETETCEKCKEISYRTMHTNQTTKHTITDAIIGMVMQQQTQYKVRTPTTDTTIEITRVNTFEKLKLEAKRFTDNKKKALTQVFAFLVLALCNSFNKKKTKVQILKLLQDCENKQIPWEDIRLLVKWTVTYNRRNIRCQRVNQKHSNGVALYDLHFFCENFKTHLQRYISLRDSEKDNSQSSQLMLSLSQDSDEDNSQSSQLMLSLSKEDYDMKYFNFDKWVKNFNEMEFLPLPGYMPLPEYMDVTNPSAKVPLQELKKNTTEAIKEHLTPKVKWPLEIDPIGTNPSDAKILEIYISLLRWNKFDKAKITAPNKRMGGDKDIFEVLKNEIQSKNNPWDDAASSFYYEYHDAYVDPAKFADLTCYAFLSFDGDQPEIIFVLKRDGVCIVIHPWKKCYVLDHGTDKLPFETEPGYISCCQTSDKNEQERKQNTIQLFSVAKIKCNEKESEAQSTSGLPSESASQSTSSSAAKPTSKLVSSSTSNLHPQPSSKATSELLSQDKSEAVLTSKLVSPSTSNLQPQSFSKAASESLSQVESEAASTLISLCDGSLGKRDRRQPECFEPVVNTSSKRINTSSKRVNTSKKQKFDQSANEFKFKSGMKVKVIHDLKKLKDKCNNFRGVFTWDGKVVRIDWEKVINIHSRHKDLLNVVFKLMEQTNIAVIFKNVMAAGYKESDYSNGEYILNYFKNSNKMPLKGFPSSLKKDRVDLFLDDEEDYEAVENGEYYVKDIDLGKLDGPTVDKFWEQFKVPEVKLGSASCLFGAYCKDALPKLGPLIYLTKPATKNKEESHGTRFHFDGEGELDAAHIVLKGKNKVALFERTNPIYNKKLEYSLKHDDWSKGVDNLKKQGFSPIEFVLSPNEMLHINKGRGHIFEKIIDPRNDYCISIAWDWCFVGWSDKGIEAEMQHIAKVCEVTDPEEGPVKMRTNNTIHAMLLHARKIIEKDMEIPPKERNVSEACAKYIEIFVEREEKNLSKTQCGTTKILENIGPLSGKQHDFGKEKGNNSLFEKDCEHRCMNCFIELYNSFLYCQHCEKDHNNQLCYNCIEKTKSKRKKWCYCDKPFEKLGRCMRTLKLEEIKALISEQKELKKLREQ